MSDRDERHLPDHHPRRGGPAQVADVGAGGLWFFPPGLPHSLQGLGPDGAEFVLAFDDGTSSEFNTLLVTDWLAHTPPDVLAKIFGVPAESFKNIPLHDRWIFQEVSLNDWLTHTPDDMVAQTLGIDAALIKRFPRGAPGLLPV